MPLQVPTSSQVYGPDGPWQAVSIWLGDPGQALDLYPGGVFESTILTNSLCQGIHQSPCGSGGLFDPERSYTIDETSITFNDGKSGLDSEFTNGATLFSYNNTTSMNDLLRFSGVSVSNLSAVMFSNITTVYPDGQYPLQVGELSIGPDRNQTFGEIGSSSSVNASLIPGDLAAQKIIPTNSYGLHVGIGAQALKLSLSLWLGGYDASRLIGPVSTQSTIDFPSDDGRHFSIDLLDIGIGVDHGGSPFSFMSKQGLLGYGNSSIKSDGFSVLMNPSAPYLYLPNSTCAAIAENLPVKYNVGKALYFWNTDDPQYAKIVTSPTYLSFVFRGSSGNLTIKAPFQLLNLTLEAPLVSTNTPYFPCQSPQGPEGFYSLGRAFLQAAFIGVNWATRGESQWFLAQAPGPNTDTNPQSTPYTGPSPKGLGKEWADTWSGFWTALPTSTLTSTTASKTASAIPGGSGGSSSSTPGSSTPSSRSLSGGTPSSRSLSGGAIAGIVIGGACTALIACGIGIWLFRRKKNGRSKAAQPSAVEKVYAELPSYLLLPRHPDTRIETVWSQTERSPSTAAPICELQA